MKNPFSHTSSWQFKGFYEVHEGWCIFQRCKTFSEVYQNSVMEVSDKVVNIGSLVFSGGIKWKHWPEMD